MTPRVFPHAFNLGSALAHFQPGETIGMFGPHFDVTAIQQKIPLNIGILIVSNHLLTTENFCDIFGCILKNNSSWRCSLTVPLCINQFWKGLNVSNVCWKYVSQLKYYIYIWWMHITYLVTVRVKMKTENCSSGVTHMFFPNFSWKTVLRQHTIWLLASASLKFNLSDKYVESPTVMKEFLEENLSTLYEGTKDTNLLNLIKNLEQVKFLIAYAPWYTNFPHPHLVYK